MSLGSTKASTQDSTNGTPVANAVNENGTGAIQSVALVGNKTTWAEAARTGLAAVDAPTGGDLTTTGFAGAAGANLIDLENAQSVFVRATCATASKNMTGRLVFYDGSNNPIGYSELLSFTTDATLRLGNASGDFVAQRFIVDVGAARKARFFLATLDAATTWAVYVRPI